VGLALLFVVRHAQARVAAPWPGQPAPAPLPTPTFVPAGRGTGGPCGLGAGGGHPGTGRAPCRAGGGQHRGQQDRAGRKPARRGPALSLLLRRSGQGRTGPDGPGLRRDRLHRGLPADQQPRGRRRQRDRGAAGRRPPGPGAADRHRPRDRPGGAEDRPRTPAGHRLRRRASAAGGRPGAGHRQPFQRRADRDLGHRQRAGPQPAGAVDLRELHPDRRCDQPRQFRRCAGRRPGQPDRHQHGHLLAQRGQHGHRLCHPGGHRAPGDGRPGARRPGAPRLDRRRAARPDAGGGRDLWPADPSRCADHRRAGQRAGEQGRPAARRRGAAHRRNAGGQHTATAGCGGRTASPRARPPSGCSAATRRWTWWSPWRCGLER
jgi:hypothetical protein